MRLLFRKDGENILIDKKVQMEVLVNISGESAMIINGMRGGIPCKADGGEYTLIEDDYCVTCWGSGEVAADEEDGEGHTAKGVGTQKCPDCMGKGFTGSETNNE